MAIKITLTPTTASGGVNFDTFLTDFFADFNFSGWPYIFGGEGQFEGDEIVILDTLEEQPRDTRAVILDGKEFVYYFPAHTLSGKLKSVTLATLGDSYKGNDSFQLDGNGHITNFAAQVTISGLSVSNKEGEKGDFHDLIYALMGNGHESGAADPSELIAAVYSEKHVLNGSEGGDTYTGTKFDDKIKGNGGDDLLAGAGGKDKITGGAGADQLRGDKGADSFVFKALGDSVADLAGRDTILDFTGKDRIDLSAIDAEEGGGNQDFSFIGADAFGGNAGELRYAQDGGSTRIEADVDGDKQTDLVIHLAGTFNLSQGDFVL